MRVMYQMYLSSTYSLPMCVRNRMSQMLNLCGITNSLQGKRGTGSVYKLTTSSTVRLLKNKAIILCYWVSGILNRETICVVTMLLASEVCEKR